jgi:hypothetical protein
LIFPGVRIERLDDDAAPAAQAVDKGAKPVRPKDRTGT